MKQTLVPLLILAAAALQACAAKPDPAPSIDLLAMNCATQHSLADAVPLAFDPEKEKVTTATLDGKAPCIQNSTGGRALYKVFSLPRTETPYVIAIRSLPWAETILAPKTVFLDKDGNPIRESSHADFTFRGLTLSSLLRNHAGEDYLVVESDPEVLGTTVSRIVGTVNQTVIGTPYGAFTMYTGTDQTNHLTLTAAGRVEATLTPLPVNKK